ncbi:MAG: hypothetical protein KAG84_02600 [Bacteroidales bacterium]|nr:hypothetical protein [Bacteroidales bacterium]
MPSVCLNFEINHIDNILNIKGIDSLNENSIKKISNDIVINHYLKVNKVLSEISDEFGSLFKYSISISNETLLHYRKYAPEFLKSISVLNKRSIAINSTISNVYSIDSKNKLNNEIADNSELIYDLLGFKSSDILFANNFVCADLLNNIDSTTIGAIWANNNLYKDYINEVLLIDEAIDLKLLQAETDLQSAFMNDTLDLASIINTLNSKPDNTQVVNININYSDFINNDVLLKKLRDFPEILMSESNYAFSSSSELINHVQAVSIPNNNKKLDDTIADILMRDEKSKSFATHINSINADINKCKNIEKSELWKSVSSLNMVSNINNEVYSKAYIVRLLGISDSFENIIDNKFEELINTLDVCLEEDNLKNSQYRFADIETMPKVKLRKLFKGIDASTIYFSLQNQSIILKDRVLSNIPYKILDKVEEQMQNETTNDNKVEVRNARRRLLSKLKKLS